MVAPREGKTYSLCGGDRDSDEYYRNIRELADTFTKNVDLARLLTTVRDTSKRKRRLKKLLLQGSNGSFESLVLRTLNERLSSHTANVASHLRGLSLTQRWDRTLATSEEQYHLYMIEIELVNRLNRAGFRSSDTRLAFLPHCLHDLTADCRSSRRGEDYTCKGCSKECTINAVSKLLRRHGTTPYIWMTANVQSLLKRLQKEGKRVGVLGIACIPELVRGMRMCMNLGVPVTGIPLDANRCARWWGTFYANTVNLRELETLLGPDTRIYPRRLDTSRVG